jgi:hypothetical protein
MLGNPFAIHEDRVRTGPVAFAEALALTVRLIIDEWTWLHESRTDGLPGCGSSRQECFAAIANMAAHPDGPGITPELVHDARLFGNYWTC